MSRHRPARERTARLLALLADGPRTARQLAPSLGLGESACARYLRELEARRRVVSVLETPQQAYDRAVHEPRSILSRRIVRRQLLWALASIETLPLPRSA